MTRFDNFIQQLRAIPFWAYVIPILWLTLALVVPQTRTQTPWLDEAFTYQYAGLGRLPDVTPLETIALTARFSNWPPTYYVTQNIWSDLTGDSLFATHLFPTLYGLIAIAAMYQLGRLLFGQKRAGLIAALLLGTSSFGLFYFHEVRGYSLTLMSWVILTYAYWRFVSHPKPEGKRLGLYLTLAVILALYSHNISVVFLGGISAYHLFVEFRSATRSPHMDQERWFKITRAIINGGILWIPWLAVVIIQAIFIPIQTPTAPLTVILSELLYGATNHFIWGAVPIMLLTLIFIREQAVTFIWVWAGIVMIGLVILNVGLDELFDARHILPMLLILILLTTRGILALERFHPALMIGVVGVWVGLGAAISSAPLSEIQTLISIPVEAVAELDTLSENCVSERDVVVMSMTIERLEPDINAVINLYYYFGRDYSIYQMMSLQNATIPPEDLPAHLQADAAETALEAILTNTPDVYLFARTDISNHAQLLAFGNTLESSGFEVCEPLLQSHILGLVYTQEDNCDELTACA